MRSLGSPNFVVGYRSSRESFLDLESVMVLPEITVITAVVITLAMYLVGKEITLKK